MNTSADCKPLHVLITGGRAPVALELSRRFASYGYRVFVAESVDYHLCRVSNSVIKSYKVPQAAVDEAGYWHAIRSIILDQNINIVIPTCEEVYYLARGKDYLQTGTNCMIYCDSFQILDQLHNKFSFIELSKSHGFITPPTRQIHSIEQLYVLLNDNEFDNKVVLKPVYSRFATHVHILDLNNSNVYKKLLTMQHHITPATPWVAQQHINGKQYCTYSVAHSGQITAHATYIPTYTAGRGAGIHFTAIEHQAIWDWVKHFVKEVDFTGQISFDFIEAIDGKVYAIECNPRATSGVHLFADSEVLVKSIIGSDIGSETPLFPDYNRSSMLTLAMLIFVTKHLMFPNRWKPWLTSFIGSSDAVYNRKDPKPFFEQFRILLETLRTANVHQISMMEASTLDIEWNGDRL